MSSNAALRKVQWLINAKKGGHSGALDPIATGILPLSFGDASKFSQAWLESDKTYVTDMQLGVVTDSYDIEGEIVARNNVPSITLEQVQALLDAHFTGAIEQTPPAFSALKVDGKPLYELARAGDPRALEEMAKKRRTITVFHAKALSLDGDMLKLEYKVSKGTYIRSLVHDLGQLLGCGGHIQTLRRIQHGPFTIDQCVDWDAALAHAKDYLQPIGTGINAPKFVVGEQFITPIMNGNPIKDERFAGEAGTYQLRDVNDRFLGLAEVSSTGEVKPRRLVQKDALS
ncbi:tRNA pseudouridine(55) synthase TruB [Salinibius halmophilus]|uniref:tRNA pseudouridine(55) synthase TruB n=1 Tax=Salinibius halmophilus TaxID=1853216 RepID=UPI000E6682D5